MGTRGDVGVWRVVGGADSGGLVVRTGQERESALVGTRLSKGALLEGLELVGDRLRYKLISGFGPSAGWISTKARGKPLAERTNLDSSQTTGGAPQPQPLAVAARPRVVAEAPGAAAGPQGPAAAGHDVWAGAFSERVEKLGGASAYDDLDDAELASKCQAQGFAPDRLERPENAGRLLERLEQLERKSCLAMVNELRARGFAEPKGEEREPTGDLLREVMLWEQLRLTELRNVCRERLLPLEGSKTRQDFMRLLAKASWEARGIPAWRLASLIVAYGLLDLFDHMEEKSFEELVEQCERRFLPAEDCSEKSTLLKRLRTGLVWEHLAPAELQRECAARGLLQGELQEGAGDSQGFTQSQRDRLLEQLYEHMWAEPFAKDEDAARISGLFEKLQLPLSADLAEVKKAKGAALGYIIWDRSPKESHVARQLKEATEAFEELVELLQRRDASSSSSARSPGQPRGPAEGPPSEEAEAREDAVSRPSRAASASDDVSRPSRAASASDAACGGGGASSSRAVAEEADCVERPEGMWLSDDSNSFYEIRVMKDSPEGRQLGFYRRITNCDMVWGPLRFSSSFLDWTWEGELSNGGSVRLRRQGPCMVSCYLAPDDSQWQQPRLAKRPTAYVWYDANWHEKGYRYAHLLGEVPASFPIVGLTTGWLPAVVLEETTSSGSKKGNVKVRIPGPFCDPFDAVPHQPANNVGIVPLVPAKSFSGPKMNPKAQVVGPPTSRPTLTSLLCGSRGSGAKGGKLGKGGRSGKGRPGLLGVKGARGIANRLGGPTFQSQRSAGQEAPFRSWTRPVPRRQRQTDLDVWVPADHVISAPRGSPPQPLLSVLCIRWFDYWSDPSESSDFWTLNDGFFLDLFQGPCSIGQTLPRDFEVCTVFVRSTRDLQRLDPRQLRAILRGRNAVAWYFLWPSADTPGFVSEPEFFAFTQAMERVPIRSGWPHEMALYRQLCGKLWVPQMSLNKEFRVPPTTRIHYAEFKRDPRKAVLRALDALVRLRERVWGQSSVPDGAIPVVAKLGFSWGGSDVLPCRGLSPTMASVRRLFSRSNFHDSCEQTVCLLQEMVPSVVGEHRVLCMYDRRREQHRRESFWMLCNKTPEGPGGGGDFRLASSSVLGRDGVLDRFFDSDEVAMKSAEEQAQRLVDRWLRWFKTESTRPPQCTRIDFLVAHTGPGTADVWTCEVGECGASLCSVEVHGRNAAALNAAVLSDTSGRLPVAIPERIPRNGGWKS